VRSTFAFVGRLVGTKGLQTLLEAAQQLSSEGFSYCIKVIGDGPDREALQKQATALGLNGSVQWLGYVPPDRLEAQLASVATVIMPSIAGEVFGMVALENMARGKLVIFSDIGAMREVVGDKGFSFTPGVADELAHCMKKVLREPFLAQQLGREARERVATIFHESGMLRGHLDIYSEVTACGN
jgi:rhamnosyl/mannosyltransferase